MKRWTSLLLLLLLPLTMAPRTSFDEGSQYTVHVDTLSSWMRVNSATPVTVTVENLTHEDVTASVDLSVALHVKGAKVDNAVRILAATGGCTPASPTLLQCLISPVPAGGEQSAKMIVRASAVGELVINVGGRDEKADPAVVQVTAPRRAGRR
ncbi:MAG TPA: hypothetical protein VM287_05435 [Egibacteraceae bacterium]|nr:hypothetical protein [Egibacteraceae bacterium]HVM21431.1 hypothetical protein [Egibacteraceae bacterium]